MFRYQIIAAFIKESLPLPGDVADLVPPYLNEEWNDLEVAEMSYKSNRFYFFKESFHSNFCSGAKIAGFLLRIFFLYPLFLLEGIIQLIFCCYPDKGNDEENNPWYLTSLIFHITKPLGIILGLILSIVPALFFSFEKTINRPSGETVYNLLKNLHELAASDQTNDKNKAISMISNIIKEYECKDDISEFSGYLFSRDKESEALCLDLKNNDLSVEEKAKAISSYMETQSRNAGKELYHIILDKLNPPTEFDFSSFSLRTSPVLEEHYFY